MEKESEKALVIFDLDGTLTPSKGKASKEIIESLIKLLDRFKIAIITGGKLDQIMRQLHINNWPTKKDLYLLPTSGARCIILNNDGSKQMIYSCDFSVKEKAIIYKAIHTSISKSKHEPGHVFGDMIEDRESQITISMCGQEASENIKMSWREKNLNVLNEIAGYIRELLPDFSVKLGGLTSIDITRKGIDKGFGIVAIQRIAGAVGTFVGDNLTNGGNDAPALTCGIRCIEVKSPMETLKIIKELLNK